MRSPKADDGVDNRRGVNRGAAVDDGNKDSVLLAVVAAKQDGRLLKDPFFCFFFKAHLNDRLGYSLNRVVTGEGDQTSKRQRKGVENLGTSVQPCGRIH